MTGFGIGGLLALVIVLFKLDRSLGPILICLGAIVGAVLALTRFRRLLVFVAGLAVVGLLVIAYTPLVPWLTTPPLAGDALEPTPAIVVLGAGVRDDQSFPVQSQDRLLEAFRLVRAGKAQRIVLPGAAGYWAPAVRAQMRALGLDYPVEEASLDRPILNTHDEALAIAAFMRQRGWDRVILVTNAWHMRRAAAVFEHAGVHVLRAPCVEGDYNAAAPAMIDDRMLALRDWLHESIGYRVYRWRGWI